MSNNIKNIIEQYGYNISNQKRNIGGISIIFPNDDESPLWVMYGYMTWEVPRTLAQEFLLNLEEATGKTINRTGIENFFSNEESNNGNSQDSSRNDNKGNDRDIQDNFEDF